MKTKFILVVLALLGIIGNVRADNAITIGDVTVAAGSTAVIPVSITNEKILRGFEFHLALPSGVTVEKNTVTDRATDFPIGSNLSEGVYKYSSTSLEGVEISGHDGVVFNITINVPETVEPNTYTLQISNAKLFNNDSTEQPVAKTTATLTVEEAEEPVEIEDFQFYAKKITVDDKTKTATLDICLKNTAFVTGFSFNLNLPKDIAIHQEKNIFGSLYDDIQYSERMRGLNIVKNNLLLGNGCSFSYTFDNSNYINDGDGTVLSVKLEINGNIGLNEINLSNQSVQYFSLSILNKTPSDFTSILKVNGEETVEVNVSDKNWATLCLPFKYDLSEDQNANGLKVYEATGIEDGHVVLKEIESKVIPAVTPVLINGESVTFSIAEDNSAAKKLQYTNGVLTGYLAAGVAKAGYVLQNQENNGFGFYKINSEVPINIPAYRCVLNIPDNTNPAGAPRYINLNNAATSIESIENEGIHDNAIYTLDGRRVETMTKGNTYIINGTKVIIK